MTKFPLAEILPKADNEREQIVACLTVLTVLSSIIFPAPALADSGTQPVDLELVLAVDVSSSMNKAEQQVQRDGYVDAFRHPLIAQAIRTGPLGRIAVTYVEWAGPAYQHVVVPWTVLDGDDRARAFANLLADQPIASGAGTSISGLLSAAAGRFAASPFQSYRRVIDISGDGPNNAGALVTPVRQFLLKNGVTINGLAISLSHRDGLDSLDFFGPHYLERYYRDCVVGGAAAFVIEVDGMEKFKDAIRRKLVLEIAGLKPKVSLSSFQPHSNQRTDCTPVGRSPGRH